MGHDNSSSKAKAMAITLRTIGGGIHAVFYKGGTQIGEQNLGDEVVVREASAEEMADGPAKTPEFAESKDTQKSLTFTGFYVFPAQAWRQSSGQGSGHDPRLSRWGSSLKPDTGPDHAEPPPLVVRV